MENYKTILLCVDFSDDTALVSARAAKLTRQNGGILHLIHVVEHVPVDAASEFMAPPQIDTHEALLTNAENYLHRLASDLDVNPANCCVAAGYTKQEILSRAADISCDLIVVGSHGRHGLALLMGSTANSLLHGARCDVLAVRV